jgi:hypothetical protein
MTSKEIKGTYYDFIVKLSIDKWGLTTDDTVYISTILIGKITNFVNQIIELKSTKTRTIFFRNDLEYTEANHRFEYEKGGLKNLLPKTERVLLSNAVYLQMITPFTENGVQIERQTIHNRLNQVKGLLSVHFGANILFYELTNETRKLSNPDKATMFMEPLLIDPISVDLKRPQILGFIDIIAKIDALNEHQRKPILLTAQFYLDGLRDFKKAMLPQAFIKLWIAIEGISMPNSTNITGLNEKLKSHYGLSDKNEAKSKFFTGHLFRIRSLMFHRAELPEINPRVIDLMIHLYYDLLCIITKSTVDNRTIKYLKSNIDGKIMSDYLIDWFKTITSIENSYKKLKSKSTKLT